MKCSAIAPNFIFSSNPNLLIMSKLEFITEGMLFKIRQHQQELPEALRRAALADYREGVFSITINTRAMSKMPMPKAISNSIRVKPCCRRRCAVFILIFISLP